MCMDSYENIDRYVFALKQKIMNRTMECKKYKAQLLKYKNRNIELLEENKRLKDAIYRKEGSFLIGPKKINRRFLK